MLQHELGRDRALFGHLTYFSSKKHPTWPMRALGHVSVQILSSKVMSTDIQETFEA
jgi:hypothetical protein